MKTAIATAITFGVAVVAATVLSSDRGIAQTRRKRFVKK